MVNSRLNSLLLIFIFMIGPWENYFEIEPVMNLENPVDRSGMVVTPSQQYDCREQNTTGDSLL